MSLETENRPGPSKAPNRDCCRVPDVGTNVGDSLARIDQAPQRFTDGKIVEAKPAQRSAEGVGRRHANWKSPAQAHICELGVEPLPRHSPQQPPRLQ